MMTGIIALQLEGPSNSIIKNVNDHNGVFGNSPGNKSLLASIELSHIKVDLE